VFVEKIQLKNFRNYKDVETEFHRNLNIIIGNNAQGKTNLVEAIFLSCFGKSFRSKSDRDLIKMNEKISYVSLDVKKQHTDMRVETRFNRMKKKEIRLNGIPIVKLNELIGNLNVVIFSPEDLKLIKDGPGERRRFLDRELSHIYPRYYSNLVSYNKILSQRNKMLRDSYGKKIDKVMLEVWDAQMCEYGAYILKKRIEFIQELNIICNNIHKKITDEKENLSLKYISNISLENMPKYDKIYSSMADLMKKRIESDVSRGYSTVGPHRDDLGLIVNDIDIRNFGSQGQQRTTALSLKLSEIEIIKKEVGEPPILIMDDVLSELDLGRQKQLLAFTKDIQTFITTTELNESLNVFKDISNVYKITNGHIDIL